MSTAAGERAAAAKHAAAAASAAFPPAAMRFAPIWTAHFGSPETTPLVETASRLSTAEIWSTDIGFKPRTHAHIIQNTGSAGGCIGCSVNHNDPQTPTPTTGQIKVP